MRRLWLARRLAIVGCFFALSGCRKSANDSVDIDGSSTVAPISNVAADLFSAKHPDIQVNVAESGTRGGFFKFLDENPALRTDINNASRPISAEEAARARKIGVAFIEIPIALDGVAIVVNKENRACDDLTVDELRRIWSPDSKIHNWSQVREGFPSLPLKLYGPGPDSGTFDFFTRTICGASGASRSDYAASENDNQLVQGVAGDPGALGYFGFGYYQANRDKLKIVEIVNGDRPMVRPDLNTIRSGEYTPLSRPLFLYVNRTAADSPAVESFVRFLLADAPAIIEHERVNGVAFSDSVYDAARDRFDRRITGSLVEDGDASVATLLERLSAGAQPEK